MSGPLNIKHIGLCTHNGPDEMLSYLKLEFVNASAPVTATLKFDGHECRYRGYLSESYNGVLTCTEGLSLPLRLWAKYVVAGKKIKFHVIERESAAPLTVGTRTARPHTGRLVAIRDDRFAEGFRTPALCRRGWLDGGRRSKAS